MSSLTDFWYIPTAIPIAITAISHINDQYVMKARDFVKDTNLLEDKNRGAKISALKEFVEHQFNSRELDDNLDSYKKIVTEFSRRNSHDIVLGFYKKIYTRTEVLAFSVMWTAVAVLIISLLVGLTLPDSRIWWLGIGACLSVLSLVSVAILYVFTRRLSKISQQEDLR